jgi:signal transduction histidine kinase
MSETKLFAEGRPSDCLAGGGAMGALMRATDWADTPLGSVEVWPQSLRTTISIMLESKFAMVVAWGPKYRFFYNDRYRPVLGSKHPAALGKPGAEIFPEVWDVVGPEFDRAWRGDAFAVDDWLLPLSRNGYLESCWFTLSYSPIRDESGGVGGVLAVVAETTGRVEGERRLATLRDLARRASEAKATDEACRAAAAVFAQNPIDVPFALLYLLETDGSALRRVADVGLPAGHPAAVERVQLGAEAGDRGWPLSEVLTTRAMRVLDDLDVRFGGLPGGAWPESTDMAVLYPLARPGVERPYGVLVAGVSPRRRMDDAYRGFFDLVAEHITTAVSNAHAFEAERRRAEALAEIDRAKTAFFSNVSHEFRTPLTLMLGPLEDAMRDPEPAVEGETLRAMHRNALRLLKLVNALLDFSRLEAGRVEAAYEPTDLAVATADLASGFRSAIERAGLSLVLELQPLSEPVYVDRQMWEKVVLNLLSNAFKFTFSGDIAVALRETESNVVLEVRDSGTGISEAELPRIFERFHRVEGARARTEEGSGIGLALVQELVRLHGGTVDVESHVGRGSTFRVSLPRGSAHLPANRIASERSLVSTRTGTAPYVEEANRWLRDDVHAPSPADISSERILVADDNADMRDYLRRILGSRWQVEVVADGAAALASARASPPDLILSDVMMPELDGFALLRALRADDRTRHLPVVMLSARAGEEARVEGLGAGADEYLVKPFSARELVARVSSQLALAKARGAADRLRVVAEAANRAKDEFLAMLSHELRNPLAPILTAVQLLRMRAEGSFGRELDILDRQARHLVRLVDDLLDVSRLARGKVEIVRAPVEIATVVTQAVEMVEPLLEQKRHQLVQSVPAHGLRINGDAERLAQVVSNLLANAARYTPPGGHLEVAARAIAGETETGEVELIVRDDGVGIAPELLPQIFDLFVQGPRRPERPEGGLGLGLAIVRSLVQLHHGTVSGHSEGLGRGSEFRVRLPLSSEPMNVASPAPALSLADRAEAEGHRVLVVDDNRDAADLLAEMLTMSGYEVRVAYDGLSALAVAAELDPEVALLDIGLPVQDGYEVARNLLAGPRTGQLRLVAITGYGSAADHERSREAGFVAHLTKPLDVAEVHSVLARILGA